MSSDCRKKALAGRISSWMEKGSLTRYAGFGISQKELVDHPHIGPVVLKLVATIQTDHVVLAGGSWQVPV